MGTGTETGHTLQLAKRDMAYHGLCAKKAWERVGGVLQGVPFQDSDPSAVDATPCTGPEVVSTTVGAAVASIATTATAINLTTIKTISAI